MTVDPIQTAIDASREREKKANVAPLCDGDCVVPSGYACAQCVYSSDLATLEPRFREALAVAVGTIADIACGHGELDDRTHSTFQRQDMMRHALKAESRIAAILAVEKAP